ncbi:MAG TPA: hypothetical protein VLQ29_15360, partial [Candidatus Dormibacteraeota bacterium]|nr:hypothetical protein [Candidatus Dormibacteraeota bacterium]
MTSFSQRKRLKPREKIVQIDSIDEELRNQLWSALYNYVFVHLPKTDPRWGGPTRDAEIGELLGQRFWTE